ncbi:hypothetical protein K3169_19750 [Pseudomonas phytophila]|uniref:DNA-binding protein n=1 Tax=Pseudomonas phytophila TaxID=2867264 RepID=A0ABY6F9N9_9PSED|nr:hypothetical protein K3169_19750 [Pseudomonas phytophila]
MALDRQGISIAEFARTHLPNKNLVSDLLNGRKKGRRGEAHRAAALLGIKEGVIAFMHLFPLIHRTTLQGPFHVHRCKTNTQTPSNAQPR